MEDLDPRLDSRIRSELEDVVWRINAYARQRPGRLAGVTIRVPPSAPYDDFGRRLESRLIEAGLGGGQVSETRAGESVVLVSMEFER